MKKIFVMWLLIAVSLLAKAQTSEKTVKEKVTIHSINQIGLLEGEAGSAWQLQSIIGTAYKQWFGGVGVGLDYYSYRSVPVFIDIRRTFLTKKQSPFLYADVGINAPWLRQDQKFGIGNTNKKGCYYDMGVGYALALRNMNKISISAGYTQKKMTAIQPMPIYIDYLPNNYPNNIDYNSRFDYTFKRVAIKLGYTF